MAHSKCLPSFKTLVTKSTKIAHVFFFFPLFIRNMQFSTSTFGLLQCHDICAAIEIGLDCRSLDESHLI